jgi:hypothetical protein
MAQRWRSSKENEFPLYDVFERIEKGMNNKMSTVF